MIAWGKVWTVAVTEFLHAVRSKAFLIGVALLPMPFAFASIASGELLRLLPGWYADAGPLSLYYPSRRLVPAKTRAFVDFVVDRFRSAGFARLVDAR